MQMQMQMQNVGLSDGVMSPMALESSLRSRPSPTSGRGIMGFPTHKDKC